MKKPEVVKPNSSNFSQDIKMVLGILQGSNKSVVELVTNNRTLPCDTAINCDKCLLTWDHPEIGKIYCHQQPMFKELTEIKSKIYIKAIAQMQKDQQPPDEILTYVRDLVEEKPLPKYLIKFALKYANERWDIYQKAKLIK